MSSFRSAPWLAAAGVLPELLDGCHKLPPVTRVP